MRKTRLSFRLLQIALFALSLIALFQVIYLNQTKYFGDLSNKVAQAIAETETLSISVVAMGEEEEK